MVFHLALWYSGCMKKRIPVSELKKYYEVFGNDPKDLRYVTHAYKDHNNAYYAYMPLAKDAFKNAVYSFNSAV